MKFKLFSNKAKQRYQELQKKAPDAPAPKKPELTPVHQMYLQSLKTGAEQREFNTQQAKEKTEIAKKQLELKSTQATKKPAAKGNAPKKPAAKNPTVKKEPIYHPFDVQLKQNKFASGNINENFLLELKKPTAKEVHKPIANISDDEKRVLRSYSSDSWSVNSYLHHTHKNIKNSKLEKMAPAIQDHIKKLDSFFSKKENHVGKDHVVYSGVPENPSILFEKEAAHTKKDIMSIPHVHAHLPAYTSTSTSKHIANDFARTHTTRDGDSSTFVRHILKINVPANHPSISIKQASHHKNENEVLLHRGTRLKIHPRPEIERETYTGKDWGSGTKSIHETHTWHAEVVDHAPDEIK